MRGREWGFITFIDFVLIVTAELDISIGSKARHDSGQKMARGMYKTKEEVERPPVWDHPCNLTRTAVKISFPAMKSEVFVNFLGYREPNLKYVMRCKGVCGEDKSQTACVATKVIGYIKKIIKLGATSSPGDLHYTSHFKRKIIWAPVERMQSITLLITINSHRAPDKWNPTPALCIL